MARTILRCQACRTSVLDAFTSLAGITLPPRHLVPLRTRPLPLASRTLYTTARRSQSVESRTATQDEQPATQNDSLASKTPSEASSSTPWYLTIEDPLPPLPTAPSPLLARQEIPPLPASPPAILEPLLNHLSISIGLDNLTLLDLRTLSPPPALGANLIMIIGTARSVKHLNVSADRFCRWLRSNYKLRPYADGLLGRNELKIKLRRKARRMKLARSAGRLDGVESEKDDGITTGWVCVNVGAVDDVKIPENTPSTPDAAADLGSTPLDEHDEDSPDDLDPSEDEYENPRPFTDAEDLDISDDPTNAYIGFGSRHTSQRIVVQMFTEEKRLEMNLEDLYANRNTRQQKREAQIDLELAAREAKEAAKAAKREEEARRKAVMGDEGLWTVEKGEEEGGRVGAGEMGGTENVEEAMDGGRNRKVQKEKAEGKKAEWNPFFKNM